MEIRYARKASTGCNRDAVSDGYMPANNPIEIAKPLASVTLNIDSGNPAGKTCEIALTTAIPPPTVTAKPIALDLPTFIEKNYVGRAPGRTTPLACSAGGPAVLLQINEPVATHTHADADEFVYVIAGQGNAVIADRQEQLSAGIFLLIPRGTPHAFTAGPKKPLVLVSTRAGEKCR